MDTNTNKGRLKWTAILGIFFACGLMAIVIYASIPPASFPSGQTISIPPGTTVSQAAEILAQAGVIRSVTLYKLYVRMIDANAGVRSDDYLLSSPESALRIAYRTAYGIGGLPRIKITIPEGSNSRDIARIIGAAIPGFATTTFTSLAKAQEGYLFPDTYFFYANTSPQEIISAMRAEFDDQMRTISTSTAAFGKPLKDIIIMASIVEREATSTTDRRIIAGVLWKRLAAGFPLQVDPPFYYALDKGATALTSADLAINSPYNTYKNVGLPPTPIDNPSLDAVLATVTPTTTPYWYYLSDRRGNIHYAATYDGQLANTAKYLR